MFGQDAGGGLIRKQAYDNNTIQTTTDYIDGFVYLTVTTGTPILSYFAMPEGRVRYTGSALKPEYIINDQQGNAWISFEESATPGVPVVRQENSYYPSGQIMPNSLVGFPSGNTDNKHLYNGGSEWQNDFGSLPDYYQTFYRNYDAALMQFISVDPRPESTESMSTYQYASNNPVMFNDPLGDMTRAEFNTIVNNLAGKEYGGSWSETGGYTQFNSEEEAEANVRGTSGTDLEKFTRALNRGLANAHGTITLAPVSIEQLYKLWQNGLKAFSFDIGDDGTVTVDRVNITAKSENANQGGINVLNYQQVSSDGNMGVYIKLALNNYTGYKNLNWVQRITTNDPLRSDLKSPYIDHYPSNHTPYYLIGSDLSRLIKQDGYDFEFIDEPVRNINDLNGKDIYWDATLTLVGINSNNSYTPIISINYGFTITNGQIFATPMSFSYPIPVTTTWNPVFPGKY